MKRPTLFAQAMALSLTVMACGSATVAVGPHPVPPPGPPDPNKLKPETFQAALGRFLDAERSGVWSEAACASIAKQFFASEQEQIEKRLPVAHYNAGLVWQRCGRHAEAKTQFRVALEQDPTLARAKVQLALYDYGDQGDAALDSTIERLQRAVEEAKFQDADVLVNLALLEIKRAGPQGWHGCTDDQSCARMNIQRALAVDDAYMPAFNQLALYYLSLARKNAGAKVTRSTTATSRNASLSVQTLDLAALVCSQAIRKNPRYAPIHNTAGLIYVELGNINSAVQEFNTARELDPDFYEAQLNYGAVNLSFRGYAQAEGAYRQALRTHPNSYEAHLGLSLALRGQISDSNWESQLRLAQEELDHCKRIAPNRPEAWYNQAILTQEFKSKDASGDSKQAIAMLRQAKSAFDAFIQKAGSSPEYAEAVRRATERKKDADDTMDFFEHGPQAPPSPPPPSGSPASL